MFGPRWRKVLRDLWVNKTRTLLVVVSIAVGIFAIGAIASAQVTLSRSLADGYAAIDPASATLFTEPFDDDLVEVVRQMDEVRTAEGRRRLDVRLQVGPDEWRDLILFALPDYEDIHVNRLQPESGAWPPPERAMLVERAALGLTGAQVGDVVTVKTPGGVERALPIAGLTYDLAQLPAYLDGTIYAYVTFETLGWFGEPRTYNELHFIVAERAADKAHITQVAELVSDKVEKSGRDVRQTTIPTPGQHPLDPTLQTITLLLGVLGILALFLSGFLVVTTVSALLAQQTRQIGIMKAIGARRNQLVGMYLTTVLVFGMLALLLAIPLGILGARGFAGLMAQMLNFDIIAHGTPPYVLVLQIGIGLLVPLAAGLVPIISGTRLTVREAISGGDSGPGRFGSSLIDRLVEHVRGLSRPVLLALRNTFRRKGRLMLTLSTLSLAGGIFIGVFSVRDSLLQTLNDMLDSWRYDVLITFDRPYRIERATGVVTGAPGVARAEGWGYTFGRRVRPDDSEGSDAVIFALPADTELLYPLIVEGRWLLPGDEQAVVISTSMLRDEPDLGVGSTLVLKIGGNEESWQVVGVAQMMGPIIYANYPYYAEIVGSVGQAQVVPAVLQQRDATAQAAAARVLETKLEQAGLRVSSLLTIAQERAEVEAAFNVIVALLLAMAVLLAFVGGLGLMGTMSINVIERTREIGVMRAIGASNRAVLQVIMAEGLIIGLISWLLGSGLALGLSKLLSDAVGMAFLNAPLSYSFSTSGMLIWLAVVLIVALLASFLPAWNATRLTVRDVLAYEG